MENRQNFLLSYNVGKKIIALRKNLNLSQEKLSEYIGISQKALSKIENGKCFPKPTTLLKLAEFFNIEVSEIFMFSIKNDKAKIWKNIKNKINLIKNNQRKLKALEVFLDNICKLFKSSGTVLPMHEGIRWLCHRARYARGASSAPKRQE